MTSGAAPFALNYPAATLDQATATLTHRVHLDDAPTVIPPSGWTYNATGTSINLVPAGWVANDIYEFKDTAKDPTVNGLGFAAVRDWNAWLRYETQDEPNPPIPNPLAGHHADLHGSGFAAGTLSQRLPPPRFQPGRERQECSMR